MSATYVIYGRLPYRHRTAFLVEVQRLITRRSP